MRQSLRFPSPLIEPDVPISGIRLSDWFHREARGSRAAFVTRLRSGQLPSRTARQLPDLSTTIWVDSASTGYPCLLGAHSEIRGRSLTWPDLPFDRPSADFAALNPGYDASSRGAHRIEEL